MPQTTPSRTVICGNAASSRVDALDQRRDHLARLRPLHGDHRPLLGDRGEPDLEIGPLGLQVVLHVLQHAGGAAGRGGHVEAVGREPATTPSSMMKPSSLQHQAVAAAARRELRPSVGVDAVQELGRVRPDHLDLAERRGVEDADGRAHGPAFAGDGGVHVLAGPREVAGALPQADILEHRAVRRGPVVDRRPAHRIEQLAAARAGERAEGHRRVGRAEGGRADLGIGLPQRVGRQIARAFMFDVLPWSVAMPVVV